MQENNVVVTDGKMHNTKYKIQYRERNSNNKRACFLSFMHYFNFQSSLPWNSFKKQNVLVNLPISTHQQDKNNFCSLMDMHALCGENIENNKCIILCDREKQLYFFQD